MKKKNVLALALAAGLVFGGTAYADGQQGTTPEPAAPAETTETAAPAETAGTENQDNGQVTPTPVPDEKVEDVQKPAEKEENVYWTNEAEKPKFDTSKTKPLAESKSFDPNKGYATEAEAIKAAEAIVAKSDVNKGFNVTKGKDGKYYIELTVDAKKTTGLERKEIKKEAKKEAKKEVKSNNVNTGVAGLTGVVATLAAASTALFKSKRK